MQPLSIFLVCDSYPPVIGGSEVEAQRVSSALIRRGHRVEVLCAGGPPMPAQRHWIDPAGVPVRILTRHSRGRWKDLMYAAEVGWALWADRKQYDIVYFLMQGLHLAVGLRVAHLAGKPIVMKFGGSGVVPLMRASRAGRWELDWMQQWGVPVLVLNQGMTEEAIADGFRPDKITWMPNPVDIDEFRPAASDEVTLWRAQHGLPTDAAIATYVGRLSPEKGLPELIRGFAAAACSLPQALLCLVGDGPQRAELEALVQQLGLTGQVRFVGRVPIQEVPLWLRASDVFALISPSEGFSCALLEAMSCGLASVVSDIPANRQLVANGEQGLTVTFGDDAGAGRAFSQLLSNAVLRRSMGQAARQVATDNYSMDRVADRYERLFAQIIRSA